MLGTGNDIGTGLGLKMGLGPWTVHHAMLSLGLMPILQLMLILMVLLLGVRLHTRTYTAVYHVHTSDRFAVRYSMVGLSKRPYR